jgi:hypothetical protein
VPFPFRIHFVDQHAVFPFRSIVLSSAQPVL